MSNDRRTRPAEAAWTGWGDDRIVGVSVDTMIVSTKSLMDTIDNVGAGTRGTSRKG